MADNGDGDDNEADDDVGIEAALECRVTRRPDNLPTKEGLLV